MTSRLEPRVTLAGIALVVLALSVLAGTTVTATTPDPVDTAPEPLSTTSEPVMADDPPPTSTAPESPRATDTAGNDEPPAPAPTTSEAVTTESPTDIEVGEPADSTRAPMVARPGASPSVRASNIPVGSILLALLVLASVGGAAVLVARRNGKDIVAPAPSRPANGRQTRPTAQPNSDRPSASTAETRVSAAADVETLEFLVEIGNALLDAGDAVGHVEATIRSVAEVSGIRGLGLLVLPTSLVLSLPQNDSVITEVSVSTSTPLRLDQIDDVIRLINDAERGDVDATEGLHALSHIRMSPPTNSPPLRLVAHMIATVGLAMILRGSWIELAVAGVLGAVIGGLRLATASRPAAYQVFWPLISAAAASASVFAAARVFPDFAVFPALVAPLVTFLPGGLLTIGVLELSTGQIVSGASRLAAGAMNLTLLAIGIVAGAQLVGVPGGDIRSGSSGTLSTFVPWVGVALFGVGIARFNGARRQSLVWILVALYVAYAGQVVGGLFFGTALSAFFGAVAMTPMALFASKQRFGPTPLVTFLPGFWLLVPGALGLDGVTRIFGQGAAGSTGALITTVTSMIGISLGLLVGLLVSGADPARPWSDSRRRTS